MKKLRNIMIVFLLLFGGICVTLGLLYNYYTSAIGDNKTTKEIVIESGSTSAKIGEVLKENNLIKSEVFFKAFLRLYNINDLKAGTYNLSESMNLKKIVDIIREGNSFSDKEISITFKEGINMRSIANVIASNTDNSYDDVMNLVNNKDYLNSLINEYWFITDDILNNKLYYSLEGYLYPDTYRFSSKEVEVKDIFNKLIKQMDNIITPYKEQIEKNAYSVHELLTLASIAELEVNKESDRANVVSVFVNRLNKKMSLGSDITTRYAIKLDDQRVLYKSEYEKVNDYNTRSSTMAGKLPIGPIGMVSKSSLLASINPSKTDYLYFISNIKTNETFFFKSSRDFEKKKSELAKVNNGY